MSWDEGDVTVDGVRLHYYRRGAGRPLVLAHGATDNGKCWERVARSLETRYEVYAFDARYHGLSEAPPAGEFSGGSDLVGFVDALELVTPVIMGHSMGAMTVAQAAAAAPSRFTCAILEDPPWWITPPDRRAAPAMDFASITTEQIIAAGREQNPSWDEVEFPAWAESKKQFNPPDDWRAKFGRRVAGWRDILPRLSLPTLLICGDNVERGAIVTGEVAAEAERLAPSLQSVTLAGAGHNVRREAFEAYMAAVNSFLERVGYDGGR